MLKISGFRNAVRPVPDDEYELIIRAGFATVIDESESDEVASSPGQMRDVQAPFERPIVERLSRRPFRDAAFTYNVRTAYGSTCAMTGIQLINGRGRSETEAAHIRPVGDGHNGPDTVRNGLALSRTVHWMFDRGLVSLTDDYEILMVEQSVPESVRSLFNADNRIRLPADSVSSPHRQYLEYHRQHIFKG